MESRVSPGSERIAAFDLDHTLLKPKGKYTFPKNKDDAVVMYPQVNTKLQKLQKDGYKIIIFTNQKGLHKKISLEDIFYKVDKYLPNGHLIDIYVAHKSDIYRKPLLGMFDAFMANNGPVTDIFYVGDAAGRKGDFSFSDAQFAHNAGLPFYTPEQFFLDQKESLPAIPLLHPPVPKPLEGVVPEQTVIILIGPPGCGKSSLSKSIATDYPDTVIVNNDTTGSAAKTLRLFKTSLGSASRIIVDNTNAAVSNRSVFAELAREHGYKVYAITVMVERDIAAHLNCYRAYTQDKPLIPTIAYASYYKRYQPIQKSEQYDSIWEYVPNLPAEIFDYSFV